MPCLLRYFYIGGKLWGFFFQIILYCVKYMPKVNPVAPQGLGKLGWYCTVVLKSGFRSSSDCQDPFGSESRSEK